MRGIARTSFALAQRRQRQEIAAAWASHAPWLTKTVSHAINTQYANGVQQNIHKLKALAAVESNHVFEALV